MEARSATSNGEPDAHRFAPGPVILFGSGETSTNGRKVFDWVLSHAAQHPRVAILETPAGFELNSPRVAGRIGDFLQERLQNHRPRVTIVPARKRGTAFSPDDSAIARPVLDSNVVFLGPGSPTYTVRQLRGTVTWHYVLARHRLGAALVLASAATIAASHQALPVYEIYKAGLDPHWQAGLDFFAPYGLQLVFIPHWNNNDGGSELDTSRCYMGQERFDPLMAALPAGCTVVGIDEHTALILDLAARKGRVMGKGGVTILREGHEMTVAHGHTFPLSQLGELRLPEPQAAIPGSVWQEALSAVDNPPPASPEPSPEAVALATRRQEARQRRDWATADVLRAEIEALGWQVQDTADGPVLLPASPTGV